MLQFQLQPDSLGGCLWTPLTLTSRQAPSSSFPSLSRSLIIFVISALLASCLDVGFPSIFYGPFTEGQ
jgi:hypothetical protein